MAYTSKNLHSEHLQVFCTSEPKNAVTVQDSGFSSSLPNAIKSICGYHRFRAKWLLSNNIHQLTAWAGVCTEFNSHHSTISLGSERTDLAESTFFSVLLLSHLVSNKLHNNWRRSIFLSLGFDFLVQQQQNENHVKIRNKFRKGIVWMTNLMSKLNIKILLLSTLLRRETLAILRLNFFLSAKVHHNAHSNTQTQT